MTDSLFEDTSREFPPPNKDKCGNLIHKPKSEAIAKAFATLLDARHALAMMLGVDGQMRGGAYGTPLNEYSRWKWVNDRDLEVHNGRYTAVGSSPDEVYLAVRAIEKAEAALKGRKLSPRQCCPLAERADCTCIEAFSCPLHGDTCFGSHD